MQANWSKYSAMTSVAAPAPKKKAASPKEGFILLLAMIVLVPVAKVVLWDTLDPDFFIHLQAANQMLRDGIGPIVDSQSFMSIREAWTPYSWLAELLMKVIWDAGGVPGGDGVPCADGGGADLSLRAVVPLPHFTPSPSGRGSG